MWAQLIYSKTQNSVIKARKNHIAVKNKQKKPRKKPVWLESGSLYYFIVLKSSNCSQKCFLQ